MNNRRTIQEICDALAEVHANQQGASNAAESAARKCTLLSFTERTTDVKQKPKADKAAALGYFLSSSLAGCANRRRHQGRHQSRGDRFLLDPDFCDGENQNGGNYENDETASCWSTRGEHAPVGSGDLPAEAERVLRLRCRADSTSEHARGFDSRSPQPFSAPGQFFNLYLGPETEWRQQPAARTQSFPTPRAVVAYILNSFPIVKRKDEAKFNGDYRTKRVILEIYDALAKSMQTGHPYQTRLNPPPADPRCCHPPKAK